MLSSSYYKRLCITQLLYKHLRIEAIAMFLTKECDYGVRIIRSLSDGAKKTVETIALEQHIPKKYAYKIVKKLERAGYIYSIRGRGGGYRLLKPLNSFTLVDVVVAIDPARYVTDCLRDDSTCVFKKEPEKPCLVHITLAELQEQVISDLSAKTMDQILQVEVSDV